MVQRGVADEPLAKLDRRQVADLAPVLHAHLQLELLRLLVEQQNPERAVVHESGRELRDARQQLVEIEHRRDLAADLGERLERFGILALPLEQSRVDDRGRDVGCELTRGSRLPARSTDRARGSSTLSAPMACAL